MIVRRIAIAAVAGLWTTAIGMAQPASTDADLVAVGRTIYQQGRLASGAPLQATRGGSNRVAGKAAACINCHQRSGFGIFEGSNLVPPITGSHLFTAVQPDTQAPRRAKSVNHQQFAFRNRPPYTDATLARALRDGVSPTGHQFQHLMPTYELNDADLAALASYLRTLSARPSPGIDAERAHFATVIAPDQKGERRDAVIDVVKACFAERHADHPGRQSWQLHVWDLVGKPDTWSAQLSEKYAKQPVFAMVSGLGTDEWKPVHQFCESQAIPCLFPNLSAPPGTDAGLYNFYFSKGVVVDAEVIAHHLMRRDGVGIKRVVQVRRETGLSAIAAAATRSALANAPLTVEDRILTAPTTAELASALAGIEASDALLVWLDQDDLKNLPPIPPRAGKIYVSGWLAGFETLGLPLAWKQTALLAYAIDAPQRREARMRFNLAPWLQGKSIPSSDAILIGNTLAACNLLSESMLRLRGSYNRDYLVEKIENYPSGMGNAPAPQAFPRFVLGPGQRYSSKGAYVARFKPPEFTTLELVHDWVVAR